MPRSRTRARIRAAKMASRAIQFDPELTPGLIGHFRRKVWHRFARLEDYPRRRPETEDRKARKLAILSEMEKWFAAMTQKERE